MKVKCEYCGHFINDYEDTCNKCGAVNRNCKKNVPGTPQTIDELRIWYIARSMSPSENFNFFIDQNIYDEKGFGIYEEDGEFIVYENNAEGTRIIKYKGTDEAYATSQAYSHLQQEILNQRLMASDKISNSPNKHYTSKHVYKYYIHSNSKNGSLGCAVFAIIFILMFFIFFGMFFVFFSIDTGFFDKQLTEYSYYLTDTNEVYYYDGYSNEGYTWWKYDQYQKTWSQFKTYDDEKSYPPNVNPEKDCLDLPEIANELNLECDDITIYRSKEFIDDDNHFLPSTQYYYYNNTLYYFIDDYYSATTETDTTGWYIYNGNTWSYYCDENDKETMGEDLWYYAEDYSVGYNLEDIHYYIDDLPKNWNPIDFETTSWYNQYQQNQK